MAYFCTYNKYNCPNACSDPLDISK